jgi:hypothetical protein
MDGQIKEELVSLMEDIRARLASTAALAEAGCSGVEATEYSARLDDVLAQIEEARDYLLTVVVDANPA